MATEDKSQQETSPTDDTQQQPENPAEKVQPDTQAPEQDRETAESAGNNQPESVEDLQAQIEDLKNELAQSKEQSLRAIADAQNARRRAEQDVEKARKFGVEKFVNDVLPVADNLERAIEAAKSENADLNTVVEGVELTLKSLMDGLNRHKVEKVVPEGEPFDPQLHQAMSMVEQGDVEPNTVVNVFQAGYTLHGRLVRPAMVVVSKAPAQDSGGEG